MAVGVVGDGAATGRGLKTLSENDMGPGQSQPQVASESQLRRKEGADY